MCKKDNKLVMSDENPEKKSLISLRKLSSDEVGNEVSVDDIAGCTDLLSVNGTNAFDLATSDSDKVCTYEIELLDNQETILKALKNFVDSDLDVKNPDFNRLINKANQCEEVDSNSCKNLDVINQKLLPIYCAQNAYLSDCPTYAQNPFNPAKPSGSACSRLISQDQNICSNFFRTLNLASSGSSIGLSANFNNSVNRYCGSGGSGGFTPSLTPDCGCAARTESTLFTEIITQGNGTLSANDTCWWRPCGAGNTDEFLQLTTLSGNTDDCGNICENVTTVIVDDSTIKNFKINQLNACGTTPSGNGGLKWWQQWWVYLFGFALIVIIFALIIFFTI